MTQINSKVINTNLLSKNETLLICPICSSAVELVHLKTLRCANKHCFDISKQGYINLFPSAIKTKYSKQLFESRRLIHKSDFFKPLSDLISNLISKRIVANIDIKENHIHILDAGCGEGSQLFDIRETIVQHTNHDVLGVGLDLSKEGILIASKDYPNMIWCVADIAKIPFVSSQFDYILNILSPSNYVEFRRLISDSGMVIKVVPERNYLQELRDLFYVKTDKQLYSNDRTIERFSAHFQLIDKQRISYRFALDQSLIRPLLQMTPLSWGADKERIEQIGEINLTEVTVDLTVLIGKNGRAH